MRRTPVSQAALIEPTQQAPRWVAVRTYVTPPPVGRVRQRQRSSVLRWGLSRPRTWPKLLVPRGVRARSVRTVDSVIEGA